MFKQVEICRCFAVPAYRQVNSDDGTYMTQCGFNIVAQSKPDEKGYFCYWVFCGKPNKNGDMLAKVYLTEAWANGFANGIKGVGKIRMDTWYCFETKNIHYMPDYVTDPTNPMFN